jgi:hypothetical protein
MSPHSTLGFLKTLAFDLWCRVPPDNGGFVESPVTATRWERNQIAVLRACSSIVPMSTGR